MLLMAANVIWKVTSNGYFVLAEEQQLFRRLMSLHG